MTHGWNDEWHSEHWLTEAQSLFLSYEDVNFVGVEWAKAGQNIDYFQSAADTQTVGRIIAKVRKAAYADLAVERGFFQDSLAPGKLSSLPLKRIQFQKLCNPRRKINQ